MKKILNPQKFHALQYPPTLSIYCYINYVRCHQISLQLLYLLLRLTHNLRIHLTIICCQPNNIFIYCSILYHNIISLFYLTALSVIIYRISFQLCSYFIH